MDDYDTSSSESKWNIDGAQHAVLFEKKTIMQRYLEIWALEDCYWAGRNWRRELDAALKRERKRIEVNYDESSEEEKKQSKKKLTEKEETDNLFKELTTIREQYLINQNDERIIKEFYGALEQFYMFLCYCMKRHGIHYREGEDSTFAILKK